MQLSTEYPGPTRDDYANVLALNVAFLDLMHEFKGPQKGRLAAAPFLLFSFHEDDPGWWERALRESPQRDLMASPDLTCAERRRLQSACIGFLWQLCRRNSYAARIISGATVQWCEKFAELPLVTLLERVGARSDLIITRLGATDPNSASLLSDGASSRRQVRRSSHVVALQALLTKNRSGERSRLHAAACSMPAPRLRVSQPSVNRVRDKKV